MPLYGTVKGALRGFTKSLAREWAPHGMPVNIVSPLALSPAMVNAIEQDPAVEERLARRVPDGSRRRSRARRRPRGGVPRVSPTRTS